MYFGCEIFLQKYIFLVFRCVSLRIISYQSNLFYFSLSLVRSQYSRWGTGSVSRLVWRDNPSYSYGRRFRFNKIRSLSPRPKIIFSIGRSVACVIEIFLDSYWHVLFVLRLMAHIPIYICVYTQAHLSIPRLDYTYSFISILYL